MTNGNGKQLAAWVSIAVTVVTVFAIQAIGADVRNRERDQTQDEKISSTQADIREINTKLAYITEEMKEQKQDSKQIINLLTDIKKNGV